MQQKLNERTWAGQLISWIHEEIRENRTIFQDATNDAGIKFESGKTKFPGCAFIYEQSLQELFSMVGN